MIKICGNLIYRSLGLIFQSCLTLGEKFPYSEFFSVFTICPYSIRMREYTDQTNFEFVRFSRSVDQGALLDAWKKANNFSKCIQSIQCCIQVSLLPIHKKTLKRFFYNWMVFSFSKNQSRFKTRDSCIYQFLSILYDIYQSFDYGLEERVSHWKYVENDFNSFMTEAVIIEKAVHWFD